MAVLRAGGGFGVILHRKRWLVGEFKTAIAAVEQADMRCLRVGGQGICIHGKAMVHAGN
ncbi:MAG: hypothetical protein RLZZ130_367, partial [Pseudomonadota bacterium]